MHLRTTRDGRRKCDMPVCENTDHLRALGDLALCQTCYTTTNRGRDIPKCERCASFGNTYGSRILCPLHVAEQQRHWETKTPDGIPICHAVGCNRKPLQKCKLEWAHNGMWCPTHLKRIKEIRYQLSATKWGGDSISHQIYYRKLERDYRKDIDYNHCWYLEHLEDEQLRLQVEHQYDLASKIENSSRVIAPG
jgi:hypothetical protein